ncbi:MAG: hypothetical protein J6D47_05130 [Peptostreptococcaceae bacterium]|nr:hypothetical protein [Peptostreptococcaceae bacterium]
MEKRKYIINDEKIEAEKKEKFKKEYKKYVHGFYDEIYVDGVEDYREKE